MASALMVAKEMFFKDDPDISLDMHNVLLRMGLGANRDPASYDRTIGEMRLVARKYGIDPDGFNLPPQRTAPDVPMQGTVTDRHGRATCLVVNGAQAGLATIADAVRLAAAMLPAVTPAQLNASVPPPATCPATQPEAACADGLRIPPVFRGITSQPGVVDALNTLVARAGDVRDPHGAWFMADNLMTLARTRGFLTDPRFRRVGDGGAAVGSRARRSAAAPTWEEAESCLAVVGDYVACGTCGGYSMAVVLRYLAGLPDRRCFLFDLPDPSDGEGVRARFHARSNVLVTCSKVPDVLAEVAPRHRVPACRCADDDGRNAAHSRCCSIRSPRWNDRARRLWMDGHRTRKLSADAFMLVHGLSVM